MSKKQKPLVRYERLGVKVAEATARYLDTLPADKLKLRRKGAVASAAEIVPAERAEVSTITTDAIDREFESVDPAGIILDHYLKNPVVLWAHDYEGLPVARAAWVKPSGNGLKAKTVYPPRPMDYQGEWFSDTVFELVKAEVLKGKSIGFLELESHKPTPEEVAARPELEACQNIIDTCLLLEYSLVPVPCNQDALLEAITKGFKASPEMLRRLGYTERKIARKKVTKAEVAERLYRQLERVDFGTMIKDILTL